MHDSMLEKSYQQTQLIQEHFQDMLFPLHNNDRWFHVKGFLKELRVARFVQPAAGSKCDAIQLKVRLLNECVKRPEP